MYKVLLYFYLTAIYCPRYGISPRHYMEVFNVHQAHLCSALRPTHYSRQHTRCNYFNSTYFYFSYYCVSEQLKLHSEVHGPPFQWLSLLAKL